MERIKNIVCGIVGFIAMVALLGATGDADIGAIGITEYGIKSAVWLVVLAAAIIVSEMEIPDKKKKRRR